jgi:hypothetical protein
MRFVFIITSALNPTMGVFTKEQRYEQTLSTIKSIRNKVQDSVIILSDTSPNPIPEEWIDNLNKLCDEVICLQDDTVKFLTTHNLKTPSEIYNMSNAIQHLKRLNLSDISRVFKITGRAELTDDFDISFYKNLDVKNKYVFKKSVVSWMSNLMKLYDTRLWSFDYSSISEVSEILVKAFELANTSGLDIEHVYYKLIPVEKVVEKDIVGLKCLVASDGTIRND